MAPFHNYVDLIADTEMPLYGLRILCYLDSEGTKRFRFRWTGEGEITDLIGLLELIKGELLERALKEGRDD